MSCINNGGGNAWTTALDVDFTAAATQTLAPDGDYTIGGEVFTKINSANDSTSMVVTNGVGVTIVPKQATFYDYVSGRTLPALTVPLSSIIPAAELTLDTKIRLWLYITAANLSANFDAVVAAVDQTDNAESFAVLSLWNAAKKTQTQVNSGAATATLLHATATEFPGKNVLGIQVNGINSRRINSFCGVWAAGWPTLEASTPLGVGCYPAAAAQLANNAFLTFATCGVLIGACRNNSGTALSVTFGAVKVEYKN